MIAGRSRGLPGRLSRAGATCHQLADPGRMAPAGGRVPPHSSRLRSQPAHPFASRPVKQMGRRAPALPVNAPSVGDGTWSMRRHEDPVDTQSPKTRSPRRHAGPVDVQPVDTQCEGETRGAVVRVGAVRGDGVRGGVVRACVVAQRCSVCACLRLVFLVGGGAWVRPCGKRSAQGRAQRGLDLSLQHFGT